MVIVLFIGCVASPRLEPLALEPPPTPGLGLLSGEVSTQWQLITADGIQDLTGICLAWEPIKRTIYVMGDRVYIIQVGTIYRLRIKSDLVDWRFYESVTLNIDGNKSVYGARDWAWDREVINGDHVYETNSWVLKAGDLERLKKATDVKVLISGSRKSVLIQVKPEALVATQEFIKEF